MRQHPAGHEVLASFNVWLALNNNSKCYEFEFKEDKIKNCVSGIRTPDLLMRGYWIYHCTIITYKGNELTSGIGIGYLAPVDIFKMLAGFFYSSLHTLNLLPHPPPLHPPREEGIQI